MQASLQQGVFFLREIPRLMRVRVENLVAETFNQIEGDVRFRFAMDNIVDQVRREASEAFAASVGRSANPYLSVLVANDTTSNLTNLEPFMNGFRQSNGSFAVTANAPYSNSPGWPSPQPLGVTAGYDASSSARTATGTSGRNPFRREAMPSQPTSTVYQPLVSNSSDQFRAQPQETINSSSFGEQNMALEFNGTSAQGDMIDDLIDEL